MGFLGTVSRIRQSSVLAKLTSLLPKGKRGQARTEAHSCICIRMCNVYESIYVRVYVHVYLSACIDSCTHTAFICLCVYVYIYIYMHLQQEITCVYIYTYTYTYTHAYICMHMYIYIPAHLRMFIYFSSSRYVNFVELYCIMLARRHLEYYPDQVIMWPECYVDHLRPNVPNEPTQSNLGCRAWAALNGLVLPPESEITVSGHFFSVHLMPFWGLLNLLTVFAIRALYLGL